MIYTNKYKIYLESTGSYISPDIITKFQFNIGMYNILPVALFTIGNIKFRNPPIRKGSAVRIIFEDLADVSNNIVFPMRVVNVDKISTSAEGMEDALEIRLVHASYFEKTTKTKAWGTTETNISNIIYDVIASDYQNKNFFTDVHIDNTTDRCSVRYQIGEDSFSFIRRIQKYAIDRNLPCYCYVDHNNAFNFRSIANCCDKCKTSVVEVISLKEVVHAYSTGYTLDRSLPIEYCSDYKILSNSDSSVLSTKISLSVDNFKSMSTIDNYQIYNNFDVSIPNFDNFPNPGFYYSNWNKTPSDAVAAAVTELFEKNLNSNAAIVTLSNFKFDNYNVGDVIKLTTLSEALPGLTTKNTNTGYYLILKATFHATSNESNFTELSLIRIK